jgi:2-methylcitrate dehydratase PrpD
MARNTQVAADHNAPPVTRVLAEFVATHPGYASGGWSEAVEHEALRTFLNWVGCAVGAARHESVEAALAAVSMLQPAPQASVLGRSERVDMASAALLNGISSHTFDFDDTHLKTIIHPAGPVASSLLALAEYLGAGSDRTSGNGSIETQGVSGRQLIDALVLGIDVSCRVGNAIYPDHYDRGWHITGSTGMLGAAAGCARLLGLDAQRSAMALGIAASQPVGMREQFGSMTKPFHPGAAARAGLMAALMAQHGYTASPKALEAARGLMQTVSAKSDWREITDELGQRFEISFNSYKPFACGIVIHPSIDACVQLRGQDVRPEQVERIEIKVHSLVLELTGKKEPEDGLQAKFSVYHGCAAGLMFGQAGEGEFADEVVNRPDMVALRRKVVATVDDAIAEDSVDATAFLTDGRRVHLFVEHAIGSLQKPMSDAQLEAKFHGLVAPVLGAASSRSLIEACWRLNRFENLLQFAQLTVPA